MYLKADCKVEHWVRSLKYIGMRFREPGHKHLNFCRTQLAKYWKYLGRIYLSKLGLILIYFTASSKTICISTPLLPFKVSMADPLSIIGTTIAVWGPIKDTYKKIRDIKDLPKTFHEVGNKLSLVEQSLQLIKSQLESHPVREADREEIAKAIQHCENKAKSLRGVLEKVKDSKGDGDGSVWATLKTTYKTAVLSLQEGKKGRVEDLMHDILESLSLLVARKVLYSSSETFSQIGPMLKTAIQDIAAAAKEEPSLSDSECDDAKSTNNQTFYGDTKGSVANVVHGAVSTGDFHVLGSGDMNIGMGSVKDLRGDRRSN